ALEPELLGHLLPDAFVVALGRLHQPADLGRRRLVLEEPPDGLAQLLLLFRKGEVHGCSCGSSRRGRARRRVVGAGDAAPAPSQRGSRGRPSTRSPRMFFWISLAPA